MVQSGLFQKIIEHLFRRVLVAPDSDADRCELIASIEAEMDKALREGTAHKKFLREIDAIVAQHGWSYRGLRAWRSRVLYDAALRRARADDLRSKIILIKSGRPYLRYVAVLDEREHPDHRRWHGTVLHIDHPWWLNHFPPNGIRCRCTVQSLSERDLQRFGYEITATPPAN